MGNITSFTYNKLGLVETVTEPNGAVTEYKYNSLGNTIEIKDPLGAVTKFEYDKNNNVSKVIDPLGNITKYTFDKLNRIKAITDAQARYYNAEIGRFISEDPWKGTIIEPNTLNPYPYVLNNPLKYVDPLGLAQKNSHEGAIKSTSTPIVNTQSSNVVNKVREEVVKEETSGTSDWSCKVANDGTTGDKDYYWHLYMENQYEWHRDLLFDAKPRYEYEKAIKEGIIDPDIVSLRNFINIMGPIWENQALEVPLEIRAQQIVGASLVTINLAYVALFMAEQFGMYIDYYSNKGAGSSIKFGSDTKSAQKLSNQMTQRGWTESTVRNTVSNPHTTHVSINKATGNPATVYYNKSGGYVIIDDTTKAIVQVSDNINPSTWIPDPSIINPYKPW